MKMGSATGMPAFHNGKTGLDTLGPDRRRYFKEPSPAEVDSTLRVYKNDVDSVAVVSRIPGFCLQLPSATTRHLFRI